MVATVVMIMLGLLLRGAAAEDISCVETNSNCMTGIAPNFDYSACACANTERTCADDGHDCTLTCSGHQACRGMTIHGPPHPHKLHVICAGGGRDTCYGIQVHGEASAGVRFTCGTTWNYNHFCGYDADIFCPGCAQNGITGACAAYPAGRIGSGGCSVRGAASQGQHGTCTGMDVYSGPRGTAVACLEEPGTAAVSTSQNTCRSLQLHAPPDAGAP